MRALLVLGAIIVLGLAGWLLYLAIRRARAVRQQRARWATEQWANRGQTVVGIRRRPTPERVSDQIVVASISDSDSEWLSKRAAAWAEAEQRAVELNQARPWMSG